MTVSVSRMCSSWLRLRCIRQMLMQLLRRSSTSWLLYTFPRKKTRWVVDLNQPFRKQQSAGCGLSVNRDGQVRNHLVSYSMTLTPTLMIYLLIYCKIDYRSVRRWIRAKWMGRWLFNESTTRRGYANWNGRLIYVCLNLPLTVFNLLHTEFTQTTRLQSLGGSTRSREPNHTRWW